MRMNLKILIMNLQMMVKMKSLFSIFWRNMLVNQIHAVRAKMVYFLLKRRSVERRRRKMKFLFR
jgi:hypothetical protein